MSIEEKLQGIRQKKTQFEEVVLASHPDMTQMLQLLDCEFQTIMIHILEILMDKVDSMQKLIGNVGGELEILRYNHKKVLYIKTQTEIKNVFAGLISRLHVM